MQSTRTAIQTLTRSSHCHSQRRHASFSLSSLRDLLPRRSTKKDEDEQVVNTAPTREEQPKGLFDTVVEQEEVLLTRQEQQQSILTKPATFVRLISLSNLVP